MRTKDNKKSESVIAKRKRRLHTAMFFVVVLGLVSVCLFTPAFSINSIAVSGNQILTDEQVVTASKIKMGNNVFRTSLTLAKKNLEAQSRIKSANIKRKFPARIIIEIEENREIGYISFSGNFVGISSDGKVISVAKKSPKYIDKAVISGISLKSFSEGESFVASNEHKAKALVDLLQVLEKKGYGDNLSLIDISKESEMCFVTKQNLKVVVGKNEKLDYKMAYLEEVLKNIGEDVRGATVDLSDTSNVIYKGGD